MPLILGTNSIKDTGYDVANSLRFNSGSSDALTRDITSNGNKKLFTFSFWVKRSTLGSEQRILMGDDGGNGEDFFQFNSNDKMKFGSADGTQYLVDLDTTRVFRDVSAWYHLVLVYDSAQSTASNRVKLYVNGEEETLDTSPGVGFGNQNNDILFWNTSGADIDIGARTKNSNLYFDGYLAEFCFIDGQALAADQFGEFDSDTNIWKPIDVSGLTFGTNGFYLDFENSGSLGADVSGNSNNFTVNNLTSIDQSTDTCTNNMPTFNSNDNQRQGFTFTQGNLKITATPSYDYVVATMGVSSGKWYWETKIITIPSLDYIYNGISDHNQYQADFDMGGEAGQYCLSRVAGKIKAASTSETTYGGSMVANDIQGFALDVDNLKLYISNNGQWSNGSGAWDSTTFNASTGVINIAYSTLPGGGTHWFPAIGNGSGNIGMEINFGSPVSAISSGNTDGNGYGNFEFPVPSGFYSLNTKNLAEYG
nr:spry domain protein [uncultured Mediterranean phage uvMED]